MRELARRAASIEVGWSDGQVEEALVRLHARRRRRVVAGSLFGVAVLAGVLAVAFTRVRPQVLPPPAVSEVARPVFDLPGARVIPLDASTRLETAEVTPASVSVRLIAGAAALHVDHDPSRVFRVLAGEVTIVDVGTDFTVSRDGARVRVEVERGEVRVEWPGGRGSLGAGDSGTFPPVASPPATPPARPPPAPPVPVPPRRPARAGLQPVPDLDGWLAEADAARARGDFAAAVPPLRRLVDEHAGDPRAPLAAFTLGRLYLDRLHEPGAAAAAFARARSLAPDGPLAEDALAREVGARAAAGEGERARALARDYLEAHPDGIHAAEMRRVLAP